VTVGDLPGGFLAGSDPGSNPLLSCKGEYPDRGLKRWRNVPVILQIWEPAQRAMSRHGTHYLRHGDLIGFPRNSVVCRR